MNSSTASAPSVRVVGTNGQISLGKQFAGRQVIVEEQETGVWLVRTATVIPDNERWLHATEAAAALRAALAWAQENPPSDRELEGNLDRLANDNQ